MKKEEIMKAYRILSHPVCFKTATLLMKLKKTIAFIEILQCLEKEEGIKFNPGLIWRFLEKLAKVRVVKITRKLDPKQKRRKRKTTFFEITKEGASIVLSMTKAIEKLTAK